MDALRPFACEPKHDHSETEFEHQRFSDRSKGTFDIQLGVSIIRKFDVYCLYPSDINGSC